MTRPRHPFQGQTFPVLGGMQRHGVPELLVVLPDGSKSLMRAVGPTRRPPDVSTEAGTLGSLPDLLCA